MIITYFLINILAFYKYVETVVPYRTITLIWNDLWHIKGQVV